MAGFGPVFLVDSLGRLVWWALVLDFAGRLVVVYRWALGAICCWTRVLGVGDEIRSLDCRWSLVLDSEGDFGL